MPATPATANRCRRIGSSVWSIHWQSNKHLAEMGDASPETKPSAQPICRDYKIRKGDDVMRNQIAFLLIALFRESPAAPRDRKRRPSPTRKWPSPKGFPEDRRRIPRTD